MARNKTYLLCALTTLVCACGGGSGGAGPDNDAGDGLDCTVPENLETEECGGPLPAQSESILVDQFGYLPSASKIAVLRDPRTGFDAEQSFEPGDTYQVIDLQTREVVLEGKPAVWNNGEEDLESGDVVHWFDFSELDAEGGYVVIDKENERRSAVFRVGKDVYDEVLKHAVRTFFYQRSGFAKEAKYAGEDWADGASHLGANQDPAARLYSDPENPETERDLRGGWYDAGDYNKYTNWHAGYVRDLLTIYEDTSEIWDDDSNIPESGNGIPDIVDEILFGLEYLKRLQNADGSVLSIVSEIPDPANPKAASPPSDSVFPSRYGPASTSATLTTAGTFALASLVLADIDAVADQATDYLQRANSAWQWAATNPNVVFQNNEPGTPSAGLGFGQQEVDDTERLRKRVHAAVLLFEATGNTGFRDLVDAQYDKLDIKLFTVTKVSPNPRPFEVQESLLRYARLDEATPQVAQAIRSAYEEAMEKEGQLLSVEEEADPYRAYLGDGHYWGSNAMKARQGALFQALRRNDLLSDKQQSAEQAANGYLHYLHGVNPLALVYLSNMNDFGAEKSVKTMFHAWFSNDSEKWSVRGDDTPGPAPGFLVGGPNSQYKINDCCPDACSSPEQNARCDVSLAMSIIEDPPLKSYREINVGTPMESWRLTENSCGYQVAYIRLLANAKAAER